MKESSFKDNPQRWFIDKLMTMFIIAAFAITMVFSIPYIAPLVIETIQGDAAGQYLRDAPTILVYPDGLTIDEATFTMFHEYGHYVYNEKLTEQQRNQWAGLHSVSPSNEFFVDRFTAEYAKTSAEEDFAQTFASMFSVEYSVDNIQRYSESRAQFFEDEHIMALMASD